MSQAVYALIEQHLGIPAARTYIGFEDVPGRLWGWNGETGCANSTATANCSGSGWRLELVDVVDHIVSEADVLFSWNHDLQIGGTIRL